MSDFSFEQFDQSTYAKLLEKMLDEHRKMYDSYEKYRNVRMTCVGDAKVLAGDKSVTDTYMDRAIEQRFGVQILEEGKVVFHRLQALATQIQGLSALLSTRPQ